MYLLSSGKLPRGAINGRYCKEDLSSSESNANGLGSFYLFSPFSPEISLLVDLNGLFLFDLSNLFTASWN